MSSKSKRSHGETCASAGAAVHRRAGDSGGFDRAIGRTGGLEHYDILAKEVVSFGKKIGGDEILVLTYCQIEIRRFFKTSKAEQAGENHMLANGLPPHTEGGPSDHADRSGAAGRGKNADLARAARSEPRPAQIIAKYAGRCSRCEKPICVGDGIRSHRDFGYVHHYCRAVRDPRDRLRDIREGHGLLTRCHGPPQHAGRAFTLGVTQFTR